MRYLIVFCFLQSSVFYGQKNDYTWVIGGGSENGIFDGYQWGTMIADFTEEFVKFRYDSEITMDMSGTDASICDNEGRLLMYTNGMYVHNGMHKVVPGLDTISYSTYWERFNEKNYLPDGSDWPGGFPIRQFALMLPDPGSENYFIFHLLRKDLSIDNFNFHRNVGILTTLVSFENSDQGEVIYKDSLISSGFYNGGFNAVRHGNGRDWWVVIKDEYSAAINIFLLDPVGIKLFKRYIDPDSLLNNHSYPVSYFSPRGDIYVTHEGEGLSDTMYLSLYDFNRCTGTLQKKEVKTFANKRQLLYGAISFSPDGHYLYATDGLNMYQYDMDADKILEPEQIIAVYDGSIFKYNEWDLGRDLIFSYMVNGPDGKIYSLTPGGTRSLHTIEYPEEEGTNATVIQNSIKLPAQNFNSLPNFPHFRMGPWDGSPCDTLGFDNIPIAKFRYEQDTLDHLRIRFTDLSYFGPDEWSWDFGDSTGFEGRKPQWHRFPGPGVYNVCLSVINKNGKHTYCKNLTIGSPVSTDDLKSRIQLNVFPNPVENDLLVTLSDYVPEHGYIVFYDIFGRQIFRHRIYYSLNNISLMQMTQGTYLYTLFDNGKTLSSGKILKL